VEQHAPELRIVVDSAGTHAFHSGEAPDPRACRAAESRGIDLSRLRARRVADEDFTRFDLIVAMDKLNLTTLREKCAPDLHDRIRLLLEFTDRTGDLDVPDPYYGGSVGFERVLDLVEEGSRGLLEHLRTR
jgi:protein-tyrosine phosphatase